MRFSGASGNGQEGFPVAVTESRDAFFLRDSLLYRKGPANWLDFAPVRG